MNRQALMSEALVCPKCGTPYKRNQLTCAKCSYLLFDPKASTVHIRVDPNLMRLRRAREAAAQTNTTERMLHLQIRGLIEKLAFEEGTEIVLGRVDLSNPDTSRFDLTPFGGHERGVSRAHALISYNDNQFTIADLGSANGTLLNNNRLVPNEAMVIRDGDQLMLGSLSVGIRMDPTPSTRKVDSTSNQKVTETPPQMLETPPRMPLLPLLPKDTVLSNPPTPSQVPGTPSLPKTALLSHPGIPLPGDGPLVPPAASVVPPRDPEATTLKSPFATDAKPTDDANKTKPMLGQMLPPLPQAPKSDTQPDDSKPAEPKPGESLSADSKAAEPPKP